jgi:hypothetical protein
VIAGSPPRLMHSAMPSILTMLASVQLLMMRRRVTERVSGPQWRARPRGSQARMTHTMGRDGRHPVIPSFLHIGAFTLLAIAKGYPGLGAMTVPHGYHPVLFACLGRL